MRSSTARKPEFSSGDATTVDEGVHHVCWLLIESLIDTERRGPLRFFCKKLMGALTQVVIPIDRHDQ